MSAETQHPYDLFSQQELLRRPLEPHTALAVDADDCRVADDAFHAIHNEDKHGRFMEVSAYIADAALISKSPNLVADAEYQAFHRYDYGVENRLLPAFVLAQLSLSAPSIHGVPAIAVRAKIRPHSVSLVDIERVRVRVEPITYTDFANRVSDSEPGVMALVNSARSLNGKKQIEKALVSTDEATRIVATHTTFTNRLVARSMRHIQMPWLYRLHSFGPKKQAYDHSQWAAKYASVPAPHEGLGVPQYCQFTSPLWRFPDLANHLNLSAAMDYRPLPYTETRIQELATQINDRDHQIHSSLVEAA